MFSGVRMKFITVVLFLYFSSFTDSKSTKKRKDESAILNKKLINKSKPSTPAIIAIEIVDPNENKTSKNSKRTIDSSLGYGYHQSSPTYQVYKYSQHDIPPYRGSPNVLVGGIKSHHFDIQQSVSYNLPSKTQNLNQYYQPGTTLYSTVNHQGQAGGLTSRLPHDEPQVPVIILRVYPNQLNDPGALHPNLPQSHPLASVVNSIDVQALLAKYVQNALVDQNQQYQQYQQPQYQYQQPLQGYHQQEQGYHQQAQEYHQPTQEYQQPAQEYQQPAQEYQYMYIQQQPDYQNYQTQDDSLLTHENYPKDTHTRVVFRTDKNKQPIETKTIQIQIPEGAYSAVQVETPDMQYGYSTPNEGSSQQYYYQQQADVDQNYYYQGVPDAGYQQGEPQQQIDYVPPQQESPHNYHAHQKRSKKVRLSSSRQELDEKVDDVIKLKPIRA